MLTVTQELSESLQSATGIQYAVKCDVTKDSDTETAFKRVKDNLGGVDILVNNAGVLVNSPLIGKSLRLLLVVLMVWIFEAHSQNCENDRLFRHVCLSVLMAQGSQWTDFHEIRYTSVFRKCAMNIQVSLQSDNNNGTLH